MSTHPNVVLMAVLTPNGLSRKTMRDIRAKMEAEDEDDDIKIGGKDYRPIVMESDYEESFQISAQEGDLVFADMVTYGYGNTVSWEDLSSQKEELQKWADDVCKEFNCTFKIMVTANYW